MRCKLCDQELPSYEVGVRTTCREWVRCYIYAHDLFPLWERTPELIKWHKKMTPLQRLVCAILYGVIQEGAYER